MRERDLLERLTGVLERAGLPWLLTGSFVSSLQGYPRSAGNLDLVARLGEAGVRALAAAFPPPDFELDAQTALQAHQRGESFPLVDPAGGLRVDFWPASDSPFDRSRFERRSTEEYQGLRLTVCSPEDTVLAKLYWGARWGDSERQAEDARGVYELQHGRLDQAYLRRWAAELGVARELARLQKEAHPSG